ncbi:MAG: hypothetical protein R3270_01480 [Gammaproteobacteria bacterium]|nr:hypothetical protein [Gammaproteobacteria bacterium]
MRISIYIACLLVGIAAAPYAAFASNFVADVAIWFGNIADFLPADVVLFLSRLAVTLVLLATLHAIVGLLAGELNFLMALLSGIVPVYNGVARFVGNLTGSRLSLNEIFYAHNTRELTTFAGFGDMVLVVIALLVSWLAVRRILTLVGIRSVSV